MAAVTLLLGSAAFFASGFGARFVFALAAADAFVSAVFVRVVVFFLAEGFLGSACTVVFLSALAAVLPGEVGLDFALEVAGLAFGAAARAVREDAVVGLREVEVASVFTSPEATGDSATFDSATFTDATLVSAEGEVFFEALALVLAVAAAFERVDVVVFFAAVLALAAVVGFAPAVGLLVALGFRVVVLAVGRFFELVVLVEVVTSVCAAALL